MKLKIYKDEYWIKDDAGLPSNFDQMNDNEKLNYIDENKLLHREKGPAITYSDV